MRIHAKIGLGEVRFGMSREQVQALLGEPEDRRTDDDEEGFATEAWYYWTDAISAQFDEDVGWRLTTIEVESKQAVFDEGPVIGMPVSELQALLQDKEVVWPDDEMHPVSVAEWEMNLWIEDGVLSSIQWWVPLGEDDEELWPA